MPHFRDDVQAVCEASRRRLTVPPTLPPPAIAEGFSVDVMEAKAHLFILEGRPMHSSVQLSSCRGNSSDNVRFQIAGEAQER